MSLAQWHCRLIDWCFLRACLRQSYFETSMLTVYCRAPSSRTWTSQEMRSPFVLSYFRKPDTLAVPRSLLMEEVLGILWSRGVLVAVHLCFFRGTQWNQWAVVCNGFIMLCLLPVSLRIGYQDSHNPYCLMFYLPKQNLALIKLSGRSLRIDFLSLCRRSKFNEYSIWQNPVSCTLCLCTLWESRGQNKENGLRLNKS